MRRLKHSLDIVLFGVGTAFVYGVIHDQVAIRVSPAYFMVGHPMLFPTTSPTLIALGWGIVATWWAGIMLAIPTALIAQVGSRPSIDAQGLLRPVMAAMFVLAGLAALAGTLAYALASADVLMLTGWEAARVLPQQHAAYLAASWAHGVSYGGGAAGGVALWAYTWRRRRALTGARRTMVATPRAVTTWESATVRVLSGIGGLGLILVVLFFGLMTALIASGL